MRQTVLLLLALQCSWAAAASLQPQVRALDM